MSPPSDGFPVPAGQMIVSKLGGSVQGAVLSTSSSAKDTHGTDSAGVTQPKSKQIANQVVRAAPKEVAINDMVRREPGAPNGTGETEQTKQRSQFYGNAFAYRGPPSSIRDRVYGESMVTAELKTNVIVRDHSPT